MTGNLTQDEPRVDPVPATTQDGPVFTAVKRLTPIKYPNRIKSIAVLGRKEPWQRIFLLRPAFGGRFLFILHPKNFLSPDLTILRKVNFTNFNSAPQILEITIPKDLRVHHEWQWRLVKTQVASETEDSFEMLEAVKDLGDGLLSGSSSARLAADAENPLELSRLVYDIRPEIEGSLEFSEEIEGNISRMAAWSCHQPYSSSGGKANVRDGAEDKLEWYRSLIEKFNPHRIWALGDTCYSDGTSALDFVKQLEDKRGWHQSWDMRKDLLSLYRLNYRYHWSFEPMRTVMKNFPHLAMWDDHEFRDGFGSDEGDRSAGNQAMKEMARQAAEEYLFQWSPTLRSEAHRNAEVDNHQAYIDQPIASFIFDGRNSRDYGEDLPIPADVSMAIVAVADFVLSFILGWSYTVGSYAASAAGISPYKLINEISLIYRWHNPGEVVSDQQLDDFARFCHYLKGQAGVRYLMMGNSVPFIFVLDFVETLASEAAITATSVGQHIRDDIRDSWHSPANRRQLSRLIDILRDLHRARPDLEIFNISGDIHISNAYTYQPAGFAKPLFQITTSALTNEPSMSEGVSNLLSVDGPLCFNAKSSVLGDISRIWHEGKFQNFLSVKADEQAIAFELHVFNKPDDQNFGARDRKLIVKPEASYELK